MIGAIIGDIVGSVYEFHNIKTKDFPFFRDDCRFTDDTVMTFAVAEGLMNGGSETDFIEAMKKYGRMYPMTGYGMRFFHWLVTATTEPYNSWGKGAAMRVSPVGFFVEPSWDVRATACAVDAYATRSAEVTHNHPEGVKGALATANAIMFMRYRVQDSGNMADAKGKLRSFIQDKYGYDLSRTLAEIRPKYKYNESCQDTVPQAITAFLESKDFEDAIRNAVSLGGDSDTLAAITGGIAQATYGVPSWMEEKALSILDELLRAVYSRWCEYIGKQK